MQILSTILLIIQSVATTNPPTVALLTPEQKIFSSNYNITKLLVPVDGQNAQRMATIQTIDIPDAIFFTVADSKFKGGTCIFVLHNSVPYPLLEGGRDTTSDFTVSNSAVYFGSINGIYRYNPVDISAELFGVLDDDIIQIQKASTDKDLFYILTADFQMYTIRNHGTEKTKLFLHSCASQFVLDTSDNVYYMDCKSKIIRIKKSNGLNLRLYVNVKNYNEVVLIRPSFVMSQCIPFFGDGIFHILYVNGRVVKKRFNLKARPSAYSIDMTTYIVAAMDGDIYGYSMTDLFLTGLVGHTEYWPLGMNRVVDLVLTVK